jgi:hypothetical protein
VTLNWNIHWPWLVVAVAADGREVVLWRCDSQQQANRERERLLDDIIAGTADVTAAWVKKDTN